MSCVKTHDISQTQSALQNMYVTKVLRKITQASFQHMQTVFPSNVHVIAQFDTEPVLKLADGLRLNMLGSHL